MKGVVARIFKYEILVNFWGGRIEEQPKILVLKKVRAAKFFFHWRVLFSERGSTLPKIDQIFV